MAPTVVVVVVVVGAVEAPTVVVVVVVLVAVATATVVGLVVVGSAILRTIEPSLKVPMGPKQSAGFQNFINNRIEPFSSWSMKNECFVSHGLRDLTHLVLDPLELYKDFPEACHILKESYFRFGQNTLFRNHSIILP